MQSRRMRKAAFQLILYLFAAKFLLEATAADRAPSKISKTSHPRRQSYNLTTKSRSHLLEVNGLRNEDVVVVIASTGKKGGYYFRDRIIPSARTWMRLLTNVFVVIEDSIETRFLMRHCTISEHKNFTAFACPREPTYVLSRACSDRYYVASGICCKFDESINFIANTDHKLYSHMKYLIQADDDTYFRVDQLLRWLAVVDKSDASSLPLVGNSQNSQKYNENRKSDPKGGVFHVQGCNEIFSNGWYQPLLLNRVAIERIRLGTADYAATKTCTAFDLSQDAGLGILFWIYQLHHILMPGLSLNMRHEGLSSFKPDQMSVHGIKHDLSEDCDGKKPWPAHLKYDQQVAIGCGKLGSPHPYHDPQTKLADMYDAWTYFLANGTDIILGVPGVNDFVEVNFSTVSASGSGTSGISGGNDGSGGGTIKLVVVPSTSRLPGYEKTSHSKEHNVTKKWVTFELSHCVIPGTIDAAKKKTG